MADLFLHDPALLDGRAYWSVSPAGAPGGRTSGGVPIGFEDDTHYVGGWQRRLARAVMAVPGEVRLIPDMDEFRYATLLHLCRARDLKLISVWNPGDSEVRLTAGMRVAQGIILPRPKVTWVVADATGPTRGGFGSTGR